LYRLTKNFRRLWVRYIVYNLIFLVMFALHVSGLRRIKCVD